MRAINLSNTLAVLLLAAALLSAPATVRADQATNLFALKAELRQEAGLGQRIAERAYLTAGAERFSLLVPSGFLARVGDSAELMLVTTNVDRVFTLRIVGRTVSTTQELNPETYRNLIRTAHPEVNFAQEFARAADGRKGLAFDARWSERGNVPRTGRIVFIPSRESILEFAMVCSPEEFASGCQALNTILATFRASDEKGQLHISPLSDKL
jgi:hypothetical protein